MNVDQQMANREWLMQWRRWRLRCEVIHSYRRMWPGTGYGYLYWWD